MCWIAYINLLSLKNPSSFICFGTDFEEIYFECVLTMTINEFNFVKDNSVICLIFEYIIPWQENKCR